MSFTPEHHRRVPVLEDHPSGVNLYGVRAKTWIDEALPCDGLTVEAGELVPAEFGTRKHDIYAKVPVGGGDVVAGLTGDGCWLEEAERKLAVPRDEPVADAERLACRETWWSLQGSAEKKKAAENGESAGDDAGESNWACCVLRNDEDSTGTNLGSHLCWWKADVGEVETRINTVFFMGSSRHHIVHGDDMMQSEGPEKNGRMQRGRPSGVMWPCGVVSCIRKENAKLRPLADARGVFSNNKRHLVPYRSTANTSPALALVQDFVQLRGSRASMSMPHPVSCLWHVPCRASNEPQHSTPQNLTSLGQPAA
nr:unnamed protein product [Digitaria exilis]